MKISHQQLKTYLEKFHSKKPLKHQKELLDIAKHVEVIDFRTSKSIPELLRIEGSENWKEWEEQYESHTISLTSKHTSIEILLIPKKATTNKTLPAKKLLPSIIYTSDEGLDSSEYDAGNQEYNTIYADFYYPSGPYYLNNTEGLLSIMFKVNPELAKEAKLVLVTSGSGRLNQIDI